jgi:hypothetical protein
MFVSRWLAVVVSEFGIGGRLVLVKGGGKSASGVPLSAISQKG